jgi:arabinan endo-1,5-alpha-L-arabinosidase
VRSADIANAQQVATSRIAGTYQLLVHRYKLDHTQKERVTPVEIHLNVDGSIDGSVSGRWTIQEGTSYINITLGSVTYRGVVIEQMLEPTTTQTIAFTAMSTATGVSVWGYQTAPSSDIRMITTDALTVDAPVYDLLGRRVGSIDRKGIYFQNGRKLFIK